MLRKTVRSEIESALANNASSRSTDAKPKRQPRQPRQRRSKVLVASVIEAGRTILLREGPEHLTIGHLCEVAGIGVGSLYEYFSSKEDVIRAILEALADDAGDDIERIHSEVPDDKLLDGCRRSFNRLVQYHRDMLRLQPDFYRVFMREFMPFPRVPDRVVAGHGAEDAFRRVLSDHSERVAANDIDYAPFLMARGGAAILETAVQERPEYIFDDRFISALMRLYGPYFASSDASP